MKRSIVTASAAAKKNTLVLGLGITFFLALLVLNIMASFRFNTFQPGALAIDIFFLSVLLNRIQTKYRCEMTETALVFTQKNFWNKKKKEIAVNSILGIYRYEPKLIGLMKFRRTYRLHSALDSRDVWTIAYTLAGKNNKLENCRIYFKPGQAFLDELAKLLPGKISLTDEKMILANLKND